MHKVKDNKIFIFSSIYILFVKSISIWQTMPMFRTIFTSITQLLK